MSSAIKKSIILGVVFLIVLGIDYYWLKSLRGKEKSVTAERDAKQEDYDEYKQNADLHDALADTLKTLNERLLNQDKILLSIEDSKVTFEYLNELASKPDSYINFTFLTGGEQTFEDHLTTSYVLEGDALFNNLFNFIWKLEHYKRLYTIQSLNFEEIKKTDNPEKKPISYIKFSMTITGFSPKEEFRTDEEIVENKFSDAVTYNPFVPLVSDYIPPNTDNLLEVNNAVLYGLTDELAYIVDAQGKWHIMQVGDKVYLGYLTIINYGRQQVEFTLIKGGFLETVVLIRK